MARATTTASLAAKLAGKLGDVTAEERVAYLDHVLEFPLTSIRSDAELDAASAKLDQLLDQRELSRGDRLYLDALSDLVEVYEANHVDIPPVGGVAVLRHLMDAQGWRQQDLVPFFGSKSVVSAVLNGKRPLTLAQMLKLSEHFGLPVDVFVERAPDAGAARSA
ncbi:MAG TPA: hypothetical protein VFW96_11180 [Thermomicrobiales bacterium]|nr:hypothetical protein [Thermomicrobiales bacterium]